MNAIINELNSMCWSIKFDADRAVELLKKIDPNEVYDNLSANGSVYRTTLLGRAIANQNIEMLKILLENGADPNFVDPEMEADTAFWDLKYPSFSESEDKVRLEMMQIMLEYGASPTLVEDENDLLSHVFFEVWSGRYEDNWEYICKVFVLLVAYGGKSDYCKPEIIKPFNKKKMSQYRLDPQKHEDGYHIIDGKGTLMARVKYDYYSNGFFDREID